MKVAGRKVMVTGCAGFIGSHLTDRLLSLGCDVVGIDNLSAGRMEFLSNAFQDDRFELVNADLLGNGLEDHMEGVEVVFHFAANPDVRQGPNNTRTHIDQNILATYRVLEVMRANGVKGICFPSTSTVYGEPTVIPTPEDYGPLLPISIYGASKLACEALISSYAHTFDMEGVIYRFANVVGPRSTHNVLHDFIRKLREDPSRLEILGAEPGTNKSYVHVSDCVEGMVIGAERASEQVAVYNIGSKDRLNVKGIADIVVEEMGLRDVRYEWTGGVKGGRGWVGDVKEMLLAIDALEAKGWSPKMGSEGSIRRAVREILGKA
ncbi:MAG: NAD-dependent epimerase/dehydratase family protein [Methanomassiliicoccales archaeon]|nr:MAG: NAD-dependent epimerase/dehydratase family protein [Methanomassiliicoccales archaeon]